MRLCYIRTGDFPPNNLSMNHFTRVYEAGLSVWEAIEIDGIYRILMPYGTSGQWEWAGCDYNSAYGRPVYEVTGELMEERGSIGEPLLRNPQIVRQVQMTSDGWRIQPYCKRLEGCDCPDNGDETGECPVLVADWQKHQDIPLIS